MQITRRSFSTGLAALAGVTAVGAARPLMAQTPAMIDTIVIGAGMAGLNTAWLLEQQGQRVMVLEARQRVGGRVLTLLDQPGRPELGFNAAAAGYGRALDAGRRAGVEWVDVASRYRASGAPELYLNGAHLTREQWAASPLNPFPDTLKSMMPWEIVGRLLRDNMPLADWTLWADPSSAPLDIPLHDFLVSHGLSDPAIQLAYNVSPNYGTNAYDVSALMLEYNDGFIQTQAATGPESFAIRGGNSLLPTAMAGLIRGDVLLGREVVGISSEASHATVQCADGSTFQARNVVCALPFATMRRMKFAPGLSGPQAEAVATLAYQPLSVAFLTVKSRYWDQDGLGASMWTDDMPGLVLSQNFGATDSDVTGLLLQARGPLAHRWDRLGQANALASIVQSMETMRPSARGQLEPQLLHSWQGELFSGGAWAYYGPGQIARYVAQMAAPAGRIHFAGEHTATGARGVEAALESSERVALEILSA